MKPNIRERETTPFHASVEYTVIISRFFFQKKGEVLSFMCWKKKRMKEWTNDKSTHRLMVIMAMESKETPTLAYWTNG